VGKKTRNSRNFAKFAAKIGEKKREIREIRRKNSGLEKFAAKNGGGQREKTKRKIALFKRKTRQPQVITQKKP